MQSMPSLLDRRRLKDRIVESVSKAVKQIQEYQFNSGQSDVVLTNHDWQFCKLVEHLDHAFLHGLRHITNGYWAVVQDFTHKATTKEVKRMTSVTTNLGRGRAWLYLALMDRLLESYLHCFISNVASIRKYYAKEALVLDQQRMEILLTLAAGLEFITFQLDVDVAYLDLSSHMRPRLPSQEDVMDRISLCSMDSSISQSSSAAELSGLWIDNSDSLSQTGNDRSFRSHNGYLHEDEENSDPQKNPHMTSSASMPVISEWDGTSRMDRVTNMTSSVSFDHAVRESDLEVIHVKARSHRPKKPRRMKKRSDSDLDPDQMSLNSLTSVSSESSIQKKKSNDGGSSPLIVEEVPCDTTEQPDDNAPTPPLADPIIAASDNMASISAKIETLVQDALFIKETVESDNKENDIQSKDIVKKDLNNVVEVLERSFEVEATIYNSPYEEDISSAAAEIPEKDDSMIKSSPPKPSNLDNRMDKETEPLDNVTEIEEEPVSDELSKEHMSPSEKDKPEHIVAESPPEQNVCNGEQIEEQSTPCEAEEDDIHPHEVKVDINFLLLLKLHVLQDDEEQLLKMYKTSVGHAEGEVQYVYLLVSSLALYLLSPTTTEQSLNVIASLPYNEIDYILLGVGDQIITIVCTNRRKQFWLTTGDASLTRHIIGHIDHAVRTSWRQLPNLSVLTEPSHQRIALRKWAAKESKIEVSETIIYTYVLVHWSEVPSMAHVSKTSSSSSKEGMLLVRSHASFLSAPSWKPYYFVLKDGMLYQYSDKNDDSPPKACVQLSGEECQGCRRSPHSERPHCFELILSDDSVLTLSAASAQDTQDWLLGLCQAVAEGTQAQRVSQRTRSHKLRHAKAGVGGDCLACCCVVSQTKLLMCHEDLQTNFFRTLGAADVTDVTTLLTDPLVNTYLVIAFETREASVTTEYWTLYFNARGERDQFVESLGQAWSKHFKVALPVAELTDVAIMKHCREGQIRLQRGSL